MALALAHTTAGYLGYEAIRPPGPHRPVLLLAAVALANGPDLDFLPGLVIGHAGAYHRGMTHTLAAVLAAGAGVAPAVGSAGCPGAPPGPRAGRAGRGFCPHRPPPAPTTH